MYSVTSERIILLLVKVFLQLQYAGSTCFGKQLHTLSGGTWSKVHSDYKIVTYKPEFPKEVTTAMSLCWSVPVSASFQTKKGKIGCDFVTGQQVLEITRCASNYCK